MEYIQNNNMTKKKLIAAILEDSKIWHNITTLHLKLPDAPENAPDDMFWNTCGMLVVDFVANWAYEPRNDSGNRNLCGCNWEKHNNYNPKNILSSGACKEHDLWHIYTHGRSGATLYWTKYWNSTNSGFSFKPEDDLDEKTIPELKEMLDDIRFFNAKVKDMMELLPGALEDAYADWKETDKEAKRREAMGYNKTLGTLLDDDNPQIVRLAKGIKKELTK